MPVLQHEPCQLQKSITIQLFKQNRPLMGGHLLRQMLANPARSRFALDWASAVADPVRGAQFGSAALVRKALFDEPAASADELTRYSTGAIRRNGAPLLP
jgi:hypothetical protein